MLHDHFKQALEDCDVPLVRKMWAHVRPHMPQPQSDHEALISVHYARTATHSLRFKFRAWSHRWLTERGLPSGLPDDLRPRAERMYPKIVSAVGVSVNSSPERKPLAQAIEKAMSDAVLDCYANGDTDPAIIKARMMEARRKAMGVLQ